MPEARAYLGDGRLELDNNICERSIRPVAPGRKNCLFLGSVGGGEAAAIAYALIETAKMNNVDPEAWLTWVLERVADHGLTPSTNLCRGTGSPKTSKTRPDRTDTRHRFPAAKDLKARKLTGIVEADETYVPESRKGARNLERKARRRGGKASKRGLSDEQVPVLVVADRSGATVSAVLPAVNADPLREVIAPVVAEDIVLVTDGHRACLATAIARPCIQFVN